MRGLDIVFVVCVLVQVTTLADLALRPSQQARVQQWSEDLAIRLSYIKPQTWLQKLLQPRNMQFAIVGTTGLLWAAGLTEYPFHEHLSVFQHIAVLLGIALLMLPPLYAIRRYGTTLSQWLVGEKSGRRFARRFATIWFIGWVLVIALALIVSPLVTVVAKTPASPVRLLELLVVCLLVLPTLYTAELWSILNIVGQIVVLAYLVIQCTRLLLFLGSGVIWRIVEYNKGAWAAITLIVTFFLGVAEVYLRAGP